MERSRPKMIERPTLKMSAVKVDALAEATRLPTEQRPTVRMCAVVVTDDMLRIASAL